MKLAMELGYQVFSEVIFIDNLGIADIYIPDIPLVYEILESESLNSFKEKIKNYPEEIEVIPLKAEEVLKEDFKL